MEMNIGIRICGRKYKKIARSTLQVFCCLFSFAPGLSSCMHNEGKTTYTYDGSGLYLTVDVQGYNTARLYLSDEAEIYGANYVDIDNSNNPMGPTVFICFREGHPNTVNIIDRYNKVTGVKSSDIDILVSSHLTPNPQKLTSLLCDRSSLLDKEGIGKDINDEPYNDHPYMWGKTEWWGDSTMFLSPYLVYCVVDYLNWVTVYKKNYDNAEEIWLGSAKEVKYEFSWKTFFYKFTKIQ